MNINQALQSAYAAHVPAFEDFATRHKDKPVHGPLLLQVSSYLEQQPRVMVIGQETHRWSRWSSVDSMLATYAGFDTGRHYRRSVFWNITRKVEHVLGIAPCSVAWSNLNRFDQAGKAPRGEVLGDLLRFDALVKREIEILRPDICLFFTNHKYDHRLEALFPGVEFRPVPGLRKKHFSALRHPALPAITLRCPHPRTIRVNGWEEDFLHHIETHA